MHTVVLWESAIKRTVNSYMSYNYYYYYRKLRFDRRPRWECNKHGYSNQTSSVCIIITQAHKHRVQNKRRRVWRIIAFNHIKSLWRRAAAVVFDARTSSSAVIACVWWDAVNTLTGGSCGCRRRWLKRFCGGLRCFSRRVGSCPPLAVLNSLSAGQRSGGRTERAEPSRAEPSRAEPSRIRRSALQRSGGASAILTHIKTIHHHCWGKLLLKMMHYNIALLPIKVTNYVT